METTRPIAHVFVEIDVQADDEGYAQRMFDAQCGVGIDVRAVAADELGFQGAREFDRVASPAVEQAGPPAQRAQEQRSAGGQVVQEKLRVADQRLRLCGIGCIVIRHDDMNFAEQFAGIVIPGRDFPLGDEVGKTVGNDDHQAVVLEPVFEGGRCLAHVLNGIEGVRARHAFAMPSRLASEARRRA